jgi:hypothetical protein
MPSVSIRGVSFEHQLSPTELAVAVKQIDASRAITKNWKKKLHDAIQEKDKPGQIEARDRLLYAPEAVLTAAIAANRKLRPSKRASLERCLGVPGQLDFSKPIPEIVRVRPKPKKSATFGGPVAYRMLHDHGLLHRTAQHAVMAVLGPHFLPSAFQFTHLGPPAAISRAKALIQAGYIYGIRLDIVEFYRNFSAGALINELPLPQKVVDHAVLGRHMKAVVDQGKKTLSPHTIADLLLQASQGIPQGSASSPIVGMICVSRLPWPSAPDAALLNFADDFQLLAKTLGALQKSIEKLTDAVTELPGGHFKLAVKAEGSAATGIDFLGHRLQFVNGKLKTTPTPGNLENLWTELNALDEQFGKYAYGPWKADQAKMIESAAEQYALIEGWMSAFSECDDAAIRWAEFPKIKLDETLAAIGLSAKQIAKFVEPWMGYKPEGSALGL